jgi:hypothetical protein
MGRLWILTHIGMLSTGISQALSLPSNSFTNSGYSLSFHGPPFRTCLKCPSLSNSL